MSPTSRPSPRVPALGQARSAATHRERKLAALIESAPPLTASQKDRLAALLAQIPTLTANGDVSR